ncbi:MAG: lysylphosphatidylglycerol synthase domain-containing protein [Alphaproteobacteria bacterium]|nr:lysylphosphatidylglycerol synthase domain-containing protein [Alphaproteobacteria bacterium]
MQSRPRALISASVLKPTTYALLALGLLAAAAMVLWQGAGVVAATVGLVRWWFVGIVAWYALPTLAMGLTLALIFPPGKGLPFGTLTWINYAGGAVNALLPVAAVGGELVKALMLVQRGVPGPLAGAAVVTDKATQGASQLALGLLGVGALIYLEAHAELVTGLLGATLVFCVLLGLFFWAQGEGLFGRLALRVERMMRGRLWWDIVGGAAQLDGALDSIYRRRARVAWACFWRVAARLLLVAETWFIAQLMGHPIGWVEALMLESLTQSVRGMAFLMPAGLGAQEGAFLLLGGLAGLPPEVALALSLVKRGREVSACLPGLLALQWGAGRSLAAWRGGA